MPSVVREDKSKLHTVVTIKLDKQDYEPDFLKELKQYSQKASMKGFRKGKTPMSVVKKMFGKSVLAEIVNRSFQKELQDFLQAEKLNVLGSPLPSEGQPLLDFNPRQLEDLELSFDIGLAPDFELQGLDNDPPIEKFVPEIPDETIDKELENIRRRMGKSESVDDAPRENDIIKFRAVELEEGQPREGGVESEFQLLYDALQEQASEKIAGKKAGDQIVANIFELEKESTEHMVRNHLLKLEEDDEREFNPEFQLTLLEVMRLKPAELDQEFFDQYFGEGEVSSAEEAREKIREQLAKYYEGQSGGLLFRDIQEYLMEQNPLDFPDDFLKRWLAYSQEEMGPEDAEREYPGFSKNLQWTLIRQKIQEKFDLQVTREQILDRFKDQFRSYLGGQADDSMLDGVAQRMMENEEQVERVAGEVLTDLVAEVLEKEMNVVEKKLPKEEFERLIEAARAQAEASRQPAAEEEE